MGTRDGRRWLLEVVDAYVVDTRSRSAQVAAALDQADAPLVRVLAHQQKGVSAMLGAEAMAGHFQAIEERPEDEATVRGHLSAILRALDRLHVEVDLLTASSPSE